MNSRLPVIAIIVVAFIFCVSHIYSISSSDRCSKIPVPPEKSTLPATNETKEQLKLVFVGESKIVLKENMSLVDADGLYYRFLFNRHYTCQDYVRLGDAVDGGWNVCVVGPYQFNKPCLVYSFGINYDFSFDDAVSIKFGCTVRAFDPSMTRVSDHRRGANIWFYKIGLAGADRKTATGWTVKNLDSIVNQINDTGKIIDYLKIDIENNEWDSLESMYKSDILTRVKQLGIEIHLMPKGTSTTEAFYARWKSLKRLEEFGFRRWYWHFNHYGAYQFKQRVRSCCYELVYINTNFLSNPTNELRA